MAAEQRERSRIEDVAVPTDGLCDGELDQAALVAAQIGAGGVPVSFAVQRFYADLAAELRSLASWRRRWLEVIGRNLRDVDSDG